MVLLEVLQDWVPVDSLSESEDVSHEVFDSLPEDSLVLSLDSELL